MTHALVEVVKNIKTAAEEIFKDKAMEKVETYLIQAGSYKAEIINYGAMINKNGDKTGNSKLMDSETMTTASFLAKIDEYEKKGWFSKDVEDDPAN